jgi:hypothetical protein
MVLKKPILGGQVETSNARSTFLFHNYPTILMWQSQPTIGSVIV